MRRPSLLLGSILFLASVLLLASCDLLWPKEPMETEDDEVNLADETVVVDPQEATLDKASGDTLKFRLSESAPAFQAGDIIVVKEGGGHLRRVTSAEKEGNTATLLTEGASLVNAIDQGKLSQTINLADSIEANAGPKRITTVDGVTPKPNTLGIEIDEVQLAEGSNYEVKLTNGEARFEPSVDFEADFGFTSGLTSAKVSSTGELIFAANAQVTAYQQVTKENEKKLASFTMGPYTFTAGPLPVVVTATLDFLAGYEATADAVGTVQTGLESTNSITLGAEYEAGSWRAISQRDRELQDRGFSWDAELSAEVKGYVRPELTLTFYQLAGPFINASPYLLAEANVNPSLDCSLHSGLDAAYGGKVQFLSYEISRFKHEFNFLNVEILNGCNLGTNISGIVIDDVNGSGIQGASVSGSNPNSGDKYFEVTTDGSGNYEATFSVDQGPDEIDVVAEASGYESEKKTAPLDDEMTVDFGLSPDIHLYTASEDEEVHKVSDEGNHIWSYSGQGGDIPTAVAVDADGNVYVALSNVEVHKLSDDGSRLWRYTGHGEFVHDIALYADGNVYTASRDGEVHKLSSSGNRIWRYDGHGSDVWGIAVDADGNVYSASKDEEVHKLAGDGTRVWRYTGHDAGVHDLAVNAEGEVYTASFDEEVHKLSSGGDRLWRYTGHSSTVWGIAVDADGNVYTASEDQEVHKLTDRGGRVWRYTRHSAPVYSVAIDASGFIYTASEDGESHRVSDDGVQAWRYDRHTEPVIDVAADPGDFQVSQEN